YYLSAPMGGAAIGRITTAGETTFYPAAPGTVGGLGGDSITSGPDGALWYLPECTCIGRMTTDGSSTVYPLPSGDFAESITGGPNGALWFTFMNYAGNGVGEITTSGQVTVFSDPSFGAHGGPSYRQLRDITVGPDGALWLVNFDESGQGQCSIESITTAGAVSTHPAPFCPSAFVSGPDRELWLAAGAEPLVSTGSSTPTLAAMDTSGAVTATYALDGPWNVMHMRVGPDGALWFEDNGGPGFIGRIAPDGTLTRYTSPYLDDPVGLTVGPDGALWFADLGNDTIGQITPP
ncbi:MAG: virginiamycin B lyase family protein, partial [Gemmatimonadales bacterium]